MVKKVCYCGSLRVALDAFKKAEYDAVLRGEIALLPCCMFVDIQREYGAESDYKKLADDLHKRKIDICDEVFVLNVNGYIGESTRSEIDYALKIGKPVLYLEPFELIGESPNPSTPPPTLQEQAQAYAGTKIDGKYPGPVEAYLAGHDSAGGEIEELKMENEQLFKDERELLAQISSLRSKLQVAEKALNRINEITGHAILVGKKEIIDKIGELATEALQQIQEK